MKSPTDSRKLKIFLLTHVNKIGAFNLNCRTITKYIDKSKFTVYTLTLPSGTLKIKKKKEVNYFHCFYPAKISNHLGILWGIVKCDIVYVPGANHYSFITFLLKLFKKPSFKRQGNIIDEAALKGFMPLVKTKNNISRLYNTHTKVFAPTKFVGEYNFDRWGIKYCKHIFLPPFIDTNQFVRKTEHRRRIKEIIFIGNDMVRKGIDEYFDLAAMFPSIVFHIVGSGPGKKTIEKEVRIRGLKNINYHGLLSPDELKELLFSHIDLHIFPSKSEGFGKVTVETALVGIPSIIYGTYGASEWLINKEEGIIVNSFNEFCDSLSELIESPEIYKKMCNGTLTLARRFKVENRVRIFEDVCRELIVNRNRR